MKKEEDYLILKWGTLKSWNFTNSPEAMESLRKYHEIGSTISAMAQKDTPKQKELICEMIDKVNGTVTSSWDGKDYTNDREGAKQYVLNYGK